MHKQQEVPSAHTRRVVTGFYSISKTDIKIGTHIFSGPTSRPCLFGNGVSVGRK